MTTSDQKELKKIGKLVAFYNTIISLLWTSLFLIPMAIFCYVFIPPKTTYILLGISLVPVFFPNSFFDGIQLSRKSHWYRRIGVKHINTFVQNGSIVNKIIKKKYPNFKVVSKTKVAIKKQYYQTYFFEKFHFSWFLFFIMVTIIAAVQHQFYWVLTLTTCNLLYNIYPNFLQQYIRLKLKFTVKDKELF